MTRPANVTTVAVSGPSSSGKTTVVKYINQLINQYTDCKSIIIHLDDYYIDDDKIPIDKETGEQNWDCAEAINYTKFANDVKLIQNNQPINQKSIEPEIKLDFSQDEVDILVQELQEIPKDTFLVLIDGFMLFHDENLLNLFDIKIFIYSDYATLKARREARSGYATSQGFWVDPPKYFDKIVWPEFIKNHQYLFENHDLKNGLSPKCHELNIKGIENENLSIFDLTKLTTDNIVAEFE